MVELQFISSEMVTFLKNDTNQPLKKIISFSDGSAA